VQTLSQYYNSVVTIAGRIFSCRRIISDAHSPSLQTGTFKQYCL